MAFHTIFTMVIRAYISAPLTKVTSLLVLPCYIKTDKIFRPDAYKTAPWTKTGKVGTAKYVRQYAKSAQVWSSASLKTDD